MKKSDIILLLSVVAVGTLALCLILLFGAGDTSEYVVVTVNKEEYARLPIEKDTEFLIESENGTNLLVIEDGKAYVKEASCRTKQCVKAGVLGEIKPIICRHNGVVVSLEGSK